MAIKLKKIVALFVITVFLIPLIHITNVCASNGITLTIPTVSANPGETVEVPIILSGNKMIAGLTFSVVYGNDLTLESVEKGNDLPEDFGFTPNKDKTSNPFKLVMEDIDGKFFSGTIVVFTFKVSESVSGDLGVEIVFEPDDIFDGNLENIETNVVNGGIILSSSVTEPTLSYSNFKKGTDSITLDVILNSPDEITGKVFVALYNEKNYMVKMKMYPAAETVNATLDTVNGKYIKVFWWDNEYKPITEYIKIDIN